MSLEKRYKEQIANYLDVEANKISLYWKGRVALYTALKSMGISDGDEVLLPAFTCVVVPNAIIYLGAKPVYVDIDEQTFCSSVDMIKSKMSPKTKCIIIQNFLGFSSNVDEIIALASKHKVYTIEDCTHGFGGRNKNIFNGLKSDCSFFSSQWNKPFSTGVGGILLINNEKLMQKASAITRSLKKPTLKSRLILHLLILSRKYLLHNWSYWMMLKLYRKLSLIGLVVGSSQKEEICSIDMPKDYLTSSSSVQARFGKKELELFSEKLKLRKNNGMKYNDWMKSNGKKFFNEQHLSNHSFLKYPVLVKERDFFISLCVKENIQLGDWFISPLHPVKENLNLWGLEETHFPVAKKISNHIVNFPTELKNMNSVLEFLNKNKDQLL